MATAIVTGASGFIGNAVVEELLDHGYQVYAIVRPTSKFRFPTHDKLVTLTCKLDEIQKLPEIMPTNQTYDIFYHFAWLGVEAQSRADTALQLQNAQWTVDTLRIAKYLGCKRFVGAGSIMEHESMVAAYTQGNKPGTGYIYGSAKAAAHAMCMSIAADIGIDLIWPEITNAYGIGDYSSRLVNATIQKCIHGESPKFTAGSQNYDFVYIDDVARAFRLIGENGKPFHEYLIGSSTARPLREFLTEMQTAIAPDLKFLFGSIPFTGVGLPLTKFDCTQTEVDTGFRANISFAEGCKRTYKWKKQLEANNQ